MNITSVLLKKVILEADSETWSKIKPHYVSAEYHKLLRVINKLYESNVGFPSFEALKLSIRDSQLLNKVYAIEATEDVDLDNTTLLEFLKNEYTQEEIMTQLTKYLDESIMMESAKENVEKLQDIILHVEDKVDLRPPEQDMQRIELFASEEEIQRSLALGLNEEYDSKFKFGPGEYILIGGVRGTGKSLASTNIAVNAFNSNRSSIYFTIEMSSRATFQRACAMATGVPARKIRNRDLSLGEWQAVAKWWSSRFIDGEESYLTYCKHRDFNKFHEDLTRKPLKDVQLDIIHDSKLSLANIKSELDKKVHKLDPAVVIVDYVNQVKRTNSLYAGQYEWTEQIEISKALKEMAQDFKVPFISPFQIDKSGEARFSKGLLDSCDAAYNLNPWSKEDGVMTFENVKMRDEQEENFTSCIDWESLKIGPKSGVIPVKEEKPKKATPKVSKTNEGVYDV